MRSKSEKIIADMLCDAGIPFVYEACVEVRDKGQPHRLYPDFLLLDVVNRRQILFEHFGLLDVPTVQAMLSPLVWHGEPVI